MTALLERFQEGGGFTDVTGMPEDFSYTNDAVMSTIDGLPLGDLSWWPDHIAAWDTEAAFLAVMEYYEDGIGVGIFDFETASESTLNIYPNPAQDLLNIASQNELVNARFFNVTGQKVMDINLYGVMSQDVDVSGLDNGLYILQVKDVTGEVNSVKFMKQ